MFKIKNWLLAVLISHCLLTYAGHIDVLGFFDLSDIPICQEEFEKSNISLRTFSSLPFADYLANHYSSEVQKVICMGDVAPSELLAMLPIEKLILFWWEPQDLNPTYCSYFSQVYTFYNHCIDGKKYRNFYYPYLLPMGLDLPSFNEKKLCALITRNWTRERIDIVNFWRNKPIEEFTLYGRDPGPFGEDSRYKGAVPGYHSGPEKAETISQYKFSICFENTFRLGYISEKIFNIFVGGCVPIYLGAPDIEKFIPKKCFIDFRDFSNNDEMYNFLKTMDEATFQSYIDAIREYCNSDQGYIFTKEYFNKVLLAACVE